MESGYRNKPTWVDCYVTSAVCPSCLNVISIISLHNGRCPLCDRPITPYDYVPADNLKDSRPRAELISKKLKQERAMREQEEEIRKRESVMRGLIERDIE